jgi:8-oxo-dGTP pyrophosphatase MutT (NUDIX family)
VARSGPARRARFDHRHAGAETLKTAPLRDAIAENLRSFSSARSTGLLTRAAVALTVVFDADHEPCIPIFQRTSSMSRHAGQMALPGGKLHEGEDPPACALRELHEELGLEVDPGNVVGTLDDFDTRSGFTITPVVVWSGASAADLKPSKFEVEHLFIVRLDVLRQAAAAAAPGPSRSFSLALPQVQVFAPTAAILYQFSEVALALPQPPPA